MKLGFFYQYLNPSSLQHLEFAKKMLKSARAIMPDVEVWQLTDGTSDILDGVDGAHRIATPLPMAVLRMVHNASLEGEWLLIDPDIVIQKDVRKVFDKDFDVALTDRKGTITNEVKFAKAMPYNLGVSFSRCPEFWKRVVYYLQRFHPPDQQQWMGDQMVVCGMIKQKTNPEFKVKILPGLIYNFPPKFAGDGKEASLVHYKGPRKQFLEVA